MTERTGRGRARGERIGTAKLDGAAVAAILSDTRDQRAVAADYGICKSTVGYIRRGRLWKHLGLECDADAIQHANRSAVLSGENNPAAKLTVRQVKTIKRSKTTERALAKKMGVCRATVGNIKRGDTWQSVHIL